MNTNSKNHPVYQYILDCVNENAKEEYNLKKQPATDQEKLQFVLSTFRKEYKHEINRRGEYKAFSEWLSGLPSAIFIDFENYKILQLAEKWGSIPDGLTEKRKDKYEDKLILSWFNFITVKFFVLCKRNKVN
jgi:hypothetical protein